VTQSPGISRVASPILERAACFIPRNEQPLQGVTLIFWTGNGFLVLLTFIVTALAPSWIANAVEAGYGNTHSWPNAVGLIIGGVIVFLVGRSLNSGIAVPARSASNLFGGRPDHSFMFMRMEYWGPVIAIAGIAFLLL
jgi:hypothetical protein